MVSTNYFYFFQGCLLPALRSMAAGMLSDDLFRPPREEFLRKKNLHDGDDGQAGDDKQIEDGDVDAADRLAMTSTFELCREENTSTGRFD